MIYELFADPQVVAFYNIEAFKKKEDSIAIIEKLQIDGIRGLESGGNPDTWNYANHWDDWIQ